MKPSPLEHLPRRSLFAEAVTRPVTRPPTVTPEVAPAVTAAKSNADRQRAYRERIAVARRVLAKADQIALAIL
jgi:hypothetical protein